MAFFRKTSRKAALVKKAKAAAKKSGKSLRGAANKLKAQVQRLRRKRKVKQAVARARKALKSAGEMAMAIGTVAARRARKRVRRH